MATKICAFNNCVRLFCGRWEPILPPKFKRLLLPKTWLPPLMTKIPNLLAFSYPSFSKRFTYLIDKNLDQTLRIKLCLLNLNGHFCRIIMDQKRETKRK